MKPHVMLALSMSVALVTGARAADGDARNPETPAGGGHVLETRVISQQPQSFHGWPTLTKTRDGRLVLVYSGGRRGHVCPFGRVDMMTSHDEGRTWTFPRTILDTDLDDRDAGILQTPKGTLLVTTFTSLAYVDQMASLRKAIAKGDLPRERLAGWDEVHARLTDGQRTQMLGEWLVRSTDGGLTWSPPVPAIVNSPHGPIALRDGRLLHPGKALWTGGRRIGACQSTDDGLTWQWIGEIPARPGDDAARDYHELHAVEATDGRIIAQIRNHATADTYETLQTESTDGGKTWTVPHTIGVWGYPSHLLRLKDGTLLMTYGYRRDPGRGNQARISRDGGRSWSAAIILSDDAQADHGYPSTAELADGTLLTVWYERGKNEENAVLRQARWRLGDAAGGSR